jgi:PIN domain nuclease of toxin-antitoxin system
VTVVIDSSALLALIKREPGFERVYDVIDDAVASPVILAETLGKAARFGRDTDATEAMLMGAGLRLSDVDINDIRLVARLHARPGVSISLADRFCLALAMRLSLPVVTADRPWAGLGLPIELRFIR